MKIYCQVWDASLVIDWGDPKGLLPKEYMLSSLLLVAYQNYMVRACCWRPYKAWVQYREVRLWTEMLVCLVRKGAGQAARRETPSKYLTCKKPCMLCQNTISQARHASWYSRDLLWRWLTTLSLNLRPHSQEVSTPHTVIWLKNHGWEDHRLWGRTHYCCLLNVYVVKWPFKYPWVLHFLFPLCMYVCLCMGAYMWGSVFLPPSGSRVAQIVRLCGKWLYPLNHRDSSKYLYP